MKKFLSFLQQRAPADYKKLTEAGGDDAARRGDRTFQTAWVELAKQAQFARLQQDFIASTNYEPLCLKLKHDLHSDICARSAALRDVVWSVAVQHGPNSEVITRALRHRNLAQMSDAMLIDAIYDERSAQRRNSAGVQVMKYFAHSTPKVQAEVLRRYEHERHCAKEMLGRPPAQTPAPQQPALEMGPQR